jgi:hypothetical protein
MQALKTNFFFTILFGITLLLPNISKAQYDRVDYISGSTTGTTVSNVALTTKNTLMQMLSILISIQQEQQQTLKQY